jgi:hypothetical protein
MARVSSRLSAASNRLYRIVVFPSDMPPKEPPRVRPAARAVLFALAVGAVPALAQNADPPSGQGGAPRSIVPPVILAPRPAPPDRPSAPPQEPGPAPADTIVGPDVGAAPLAPIPDLGVPAQTGADSMPEPAVEAVPMRRFNPAASAVVVGDLGDLEGPIAGTLDASEGLGDDMWARSDRATIIAMLQNVPAATPSRAASLLLRKVLLTRAAPPQGRSDRSFNALRLKKLIDAALVGDAADLATRVQAPSNPEILQLQADAFIRAGRDFDACGDLTAHRLMSAERFWVQLRAYCYAVNHDPALELTRSVISEQGLSDPSFLILLDGLASGQPKTPETVTLPDSLHVLMLSRLNLPMNAEIATGLGLAEGLIAAASQQTPAPLRIAAAEKALRAGVLPTDLLAQVLELTPFATTDLAAAPALARVDPLMTGLARLRTAVKTAPTAEMRADLVHTALEIGENAGLLAQVAELFAADAAAIFPSSNWGNWSDRFIRALLLAGRPEAAAQWFNILGMSGLASTEAANHLQLTLAFVAPAQTDNLTTLALLRGLALTAHPPPPDPPVPPQITDPLSPNQPVLEPPPPLPPPPPPSAALVGRATLVLGLYDAVTRPLPLEAQDAVQPLVAQASPGRRPPQALMQQIERASLSGARGEVALGVIAALGAPGARDLAPDIVVRLVRALQTAGIRDGARQLALEALLLRPAAAVIAGPQAPAGASASGRG